jgi:hypothetical protein
MDKDWVLSHLREAHEELTRTIARLKAEPDPDEIELQIAVTHMYHHLNTAWNSRNMDAERIAKCSEQDFYAWRAFPSDISLD